MKRVLCLISGAALVPMLLAARCGGGASADEPVEGEPAASLDIGEPEEEANAMTWPKETDTSDAFGSDEPQNGGGSDPDDPGTAEPDMGGDEPSAPMDDELSNDAPADGSSMGTDEGEPLPMEDAPEDLDLGEGEASGDEF